MVAVGDDYAKRKVGDKFPAHAAVAASLNTDQGSWINKKGSVWRLAGRCCLRTDRSFIDLVEFYGIICFCLGHLKKSEVWLRYVNGQGDMKNQ